MIPETIDAARNGDAGAFALIVERMAVTAGI